MRLFFTLLTVIFFSSCQKELSFNETQPSVPAQTFTNVSYGTDPEQTMDVYLPTGRTDATKIIVLVHGGAWIEGDKNELTQYVSSLQQRLPDYAIANINYRLATVAANHFPSQENDMKAALAFLVSKGSEYHISQKFVLLGASAGAHMSLLQAYKNADPKIKAVVDFFGPTDLVALYNTTTDPTSLFAFQILMGGTPATNPTMFQQSSPVNFVTAQSPPTIILHGDIDAIVPIAQSISLKGKLQTAGVINQMITYSGLDHDFWPADKMNDAFDKIATFLKANVP